MRIFISHRSHQTAFCERLQEALDDLHVESFVDRQGIAVGEQFPTVLRNELERMDALVAVWYADMPESHWCNQEIGFALGAGKPVINIKMDGEPQGFMKSSQAIEGSMLRTAMAPIAGAVVEQITRQLPDTACEWLLDQLEDCDNTLDAEDFIRQLVALPAPSPASASRLERQLDRFPDLSPQWIDDALRWLGRQPHG